MPVFFPRSPRPRARRTSGPARALAAVLALCLVLALGASMTTGRTSGPVGPIDAALLTRVVPPERTSLDATPHAPALAQLDPIPDFAGGDRSFGPRPEPALPQSVGVLIKPTPTPRPRVIADGSTGAATSRATNAVTGSASWYCLSGVSACHSGASGGMYAAAGPALRVGNWRDRTVRVCAGGRCVNVKLIDWCQCHGTRVIDLYADAFRQLGSLDSGTIRVTVSW